jgi:hypothetical protein
MAQQAQHPGGGAAGNAGVPQPPPLPVPTQVNATFLSIFQEDSSNDPAGGDTAALMGPWHHDIANAQVNTETTILKNRLAASGSNRELIAISVFTGGVANVYICPIRWDDGLIGTNPLANQFIAIEGDLIFNQPHVVKIDSRSFNLINNTVAVLSVTAMSAAYTNDPTIELTGPNQPIDAGTEAKKSRPLIVLPLYSWHSRRG